MSATLPSPSARAYAEALLELADERQQLHGIADDVRSLGETVHNSPELRAFFAHPGITDAEREQLIDRTLAPSLNPLLSSFLKLLSSKGKLGEIEPISRAFAAMYDEKLGKSTVEITVAKPLMTGDLELVRQKISTAIRREARINQKVDPEIIGGIVIRVGDQLIDGSVRAQLDAVQSRLLNAR